MILQALHQHYHRLLQRGEAGLPLYGYSQEKISYCITLSADGAAVGVTPLLDTSGKKPRPRSLIVPQVERTSEVRPRFLWDNTRYVLSVTAKDVANERAAKRLEDEHISFKKLHAEILGDEVDEGLSALRRFLERWTPDQFQAPLFNNDMLDTSLVFRLEGEQRLLHERPAAFALRARLLSPGQTRLPMHCLVSGDMAPPAFSHPAIRGMNDTGAYIVSFQQTAFTSYGKVQGANAPISDEAAFAYTTLLNHLLRRDPGNRQRLTVGDTTVVFWAEAEDAAEAQAAEELFGASFGLEQPDTSEQATQKLHLALQLVAQGRPLADIDPRLQPGTRMVVLGLAPNASRLSIRYWLRDSLGALAERLRAHAQDLALQPVLWKTPPSPWRLALCTAPTRDGKAKAEDVSPLLAGELMRAILTGGRYPQSLLANLVIRMRADGDISGLRVALCKAVISRDRRLAASTDNTKEVPVSLDVQFEDPAYLLGRLFAVLEGAQRAALGGQVNATIRDRYFGAASATPALVYGMLLHNAQNHLARVRKDKPGLAVNLERDIREIVDKLPPHLPKSLNLKSQGTFAVGYYHQAEARFKKAAPSDAESEAATTDND